MIAKKTVEETIDPFVIPTLETERLRLRAFCRGDIDDYAALNADPEVMRHAGGTWEDVAPPALAIREAAGEQGGGRAAGQAT